MASTNPFKNPQQQASNGKQQQQQQQQASSPPPLPPPPNLPQQQQQPTTNTTATPTTTTLPLPTTTVKMYSFRELFRNYWQEAITYWAVFGIFGMCVAFLGPTLLDIGCLISSGLQSTTWAFTSQLFASLIGATIAGYVVERLDANLVLFVNTCLVPSSMFLLPFSWNMTSLVCILALMGLNMGFIDCIANLQMFKVFGDSVAPFLHAMHFFYGIGAFFSPLISEPYLLNEDCTPFLQTKQQQGLVRDNKTGLNMYVNVTDEPASTLEEAQEMTRVRFAFWIMAGLQALVAILVFLLATKMRSRGWTPAHQRINLSEVAVSEKTQIKEDTRIRQLQASNEKTLERKAVLSERHTCLFITAACAALLFIYDGLQSAFGGYIYAYALKSIVDLNKTEGAYLNALFWGMFALGRLMSIFLATKFKPSFMLLCNIVGCMLAMTFMLMLRHNHVVLYIGTAVYGLFLSSVTPSTISMAEQYIDLTSRTTSLLVVVAALGEMLFPNIVGNLFARVGPVSFLIFCSAASYVSIVIYASLWVVGRTTPKHLGSGQSFVWCHHCTINKQSVPSKRTDNFPMTVQSPPVNAQSPLVTVKKT